MDRKRRCVFLDRDGVIVEDRGLLTRPEDFRILPGAPEALRMLRQAGFGLVVVSNQAVVARGLLTETEILALQDHFGRLLQAEGAPTMDGFFYCPHHPSANVPTYRQDCPCRKPRPGLLLRASQELGLDLASSFMVGDRLTDLQAGNRAGCRSIWIQSGRHGDAPIETNESLDPQPSVAFVCGSLLDAATWILEQR